MLAVSLILALFLRVFSLNSLPIGLTADEAAFGYNAYTLLSTGSDEWGVPAHLLPFLNLRSFGDYKLPLYSWLAVVPIHFLGLSEFSVRLPNVLLGSLSVISVYLLSYRLFGKQVANLSALLLAISPWSIQLSRGAFEANLFVFFIPLAIYAYLSDKYFSSLFMFALAFYSYHSARYLTPILLLTLVLYRKPKITITNTLLAIAFSVLLLPGLYSLVGVGSSRASDVGIFSPTDNWESVAGRRFESRYAGLPDVVARVFSNKLGYITSQFTKAYLTYLSPYFFFVQGAGETTYGMISGRGVLLYSDVILLTGFIVLLIKRPQKSLWLTAALLFLAPLPAALAKGQGLAANRTVSMLPFIIIAASAGFGYIKEKLDKRYQICLIFIAIAYFVSFAFFIEDYVFHSSRSLARGMNFGMKEAVLRAGTLADGKQILFSRNLSEPHIFVAFYQKLDPVTYQKDIVRYTDFSQRGFKFIDQLGSYTISGYRFGNLSFSTIDTPTLLVGRPQDFPGSFPQHFQIDYPDGSTAIKVSEIKP